MNFIEAIKTCFIKYIVFSGRAPRSEYWWFGLFILILGIIAIIVDSEIAGVPFLDYDEYFGPGETILNITTLIPSISVSVRRLHDIDRSGWWVFIVLTIIGIIPLIYWACKRSDGDENRFGPNPLKLI